MWDAALFTAFGLILSFQVLAFSLVRAAVPPAQTGRALSADNISFFGGAAVLQGLSGVAAALGRGVGGDPYLRGGAGGLHGGLPVAAPRVHVG